MGGSTNTDHWGAHWRNLAIHLKRPCALQCVLMSNYFDHLVSSRIALQYYVCRCGLLSLTE